MIEFRNISKKFGQLEVLDGLHLTIDKPEILAVLGPNGSGKTTLIKSLLGMVIPTKGEIVLNNAVINGGHLYRKEVSYLPQIANFPANLTIRELFTMIKDIRSQEAHEEDLITQFNLTKDLDKKFGHLSGGTKQKVNLVLTFMFDSPLLVLDEPTVGLDPVSLITLKKLIREASNEGKYIIVTSHIIGFVEEMADEIVFLLDGKIHFKGSISELKVKTNQTNLESSIAQLLS